MTARSPSPVAPRLLSARAHPSLDEDATPDEYAEAMIRCQGYAPSCSDHNECAHGGDCFKTQSQMSYAAARKIQTLINAEDSPSIKHYLRVALDALTGKHDDDF